MKRLILSVSLARGVPARLEGPSLVVGMYAFIVSFAGVAGALIGTFAPDLLGTELDPVALFGVLEIQPTPVGLAVYGMVTIALLLGVPLALVVYVSNRFDDDAV